ncbi:MAG: hypothetical protein RI924_1191, partial [Bacteroidota bacterium]
SLAQVQVQVNIGLQPLWGPVGYDRADYYYLPDVEAYYHVARGQFIYMNNGRWIFSSSLPKRYAGYNLYNGYKVVINGHTPYLQFKNHRSKYAKFRGWSGKQKVIKFSNDPKYYVVKGHPHGGPPGQSKKMHDSDKEDRMIHKNNATNKGKGKH